MITPDLCGVPIRAPSLAQSDTGGESRTVPADVAGVTEIILVASGKGGVGKSTVAVNLACALQHLGRRVAVLDADLYGPSVARMLGAHEARDSDARGRAVPTSRHGVFAVSVGSSLPPEAALVWKGPLVAQAVLQRFNEVAWPGIDILLVDLPPGTGDVQLTILEQIPVTGALVVTTPQRLALIDAERGIEMFHQRDIPVFGLVENMTSYICPCCGDEQPLFPTGGAMQLADRRHVAYLGGVPLDPHGHDGIDAGTPLVIAQPEGCVARAFHQLALHVEAAIASEQAMRQREHDEKARSGHQAFWERLLDDD